MAGLGSNISSQENQSCSDSKHFHVDSVFAVKNLYASSRTNTEILYLQPLAICIYILTTTMLYSIYVMTEFVIHSTSLGFGDITVSYS